MMTITARLLLAVAIALISVVVSQYDHRGCDHHGSRHPHYEPQSQYNTRTQQWERRWSDFWGYIYGGRRGSGNWRRRRVNSDRLRSASAPEVNTTDPDFWGCYLNDEAGMLKGWWEGSSTITHKLCWDVCKTRDFRFAGLENSTDCYCGNTYDAVRYTRRHVRECNTPCGGNASQLCGGLWRISLFRLPDRQL